MTDKVKIPGTPEAWESGALGEDEKHAHVADQATTNQIDEALGLQMISIRLDKTLIDSFKLLGQFHGVGYQPLMRDALKRFADCEMKSIVSGLVESQKKQQGAKQTAPKAQSKATTAAKIKKAA